MRVRRERRLKVPVGFDVSRLGPRERQVLAMHEEGMSLGEIAERLNVSYEAVKKALQRVQRRFDRYRCSADYRRAVEEQEEYLARSLTRFYGGGLPTWAGRGR
jgi:DNA-binding NarL/FixJ family response regulator